jgi:hypothetical protein
MGHEQSEQLSPTFGLFELLARFLDFDLATRGTL